MNTILSSIRVEKIFASCLFNNIDVFDGQTHIPVQVDGILGKVDLDNSKLAIHREEITAMLNELPQEFQQFSGGGWSFLQACNDKHGDQWTGLHQIMDKLFMLGIGIEKVEYLMPREQWGLFPEGMPYLVIKA